MTTTEIYFADLTHTGVGINANTFPLGIGLVAAYALATVPGVSCEIFKFPDDLNRALARKAPRILALSNYAWNSNLSCLFAAKVKQRSPATVVVMGGPNLPLDDQGRQSFLARNPAIDFYIRWDGEAAFAELLKLLIAANFDPAVIKADERPLINGSHLWRGRYVQGPDQRVADLKSIPSPYTERLFDKFFADPLMPLIETTRGCPYGCTYCNDGHAVRGKVYRRDLAAIREELDYIAERVTATPQLSMADLNFGMYQEDVAVAEMMAEVMRRTGWPRRIDVSVGKSQPRRILQATEIINRAEAGAFKFGASFQSTDDEVLANIRRKNVPFEQLVAMKEDRGEAAEYFTEIILGLPGDSKEKHYQSLAHVIDTLGMNNIDVHQLTMLSGTEMALPYQRQAFALETRHRVYVGCIGYYDLYGEKLPCAEFEEMVVSNATMSWDDYLDCRVMDLGSKLFIDHEPFRELFSFLRELGLSEFDFLRRLMEDHVPRQPGLGALIADYRKANSRFLFQDGAEASTFLAAPGNMEKYLSGEYGFNEMLHFRAVANLEFSDDLHRAVTEGGIALLADQGQLTQDREDFLREAVEFSRLRKCDMAAIERVKRGRFHFDPMVLATGGGGQSPQSHLVPEYELEFEHDPHSLATLRGMLETWGRQSAFRLGKTFQKANLMRFDRKWRRVGP